MADEFSPPDGEGARETRRVFQDGRHQVPGREPVTQRAAERADQLPESLSEPSRFGPGVRPVRSPQNTGQSGDPLEAIWRGGHPVIRDRRTILSRRMVSEALTVILLTASGVVLFLRFHHAAFRITGVGITRQARAGCGIDLTGRIMTNGSAGTVTYEWLFRPETQRPQRLSQTVAAGQRALDVTVVIDAAGNAPKMVTLRVLGGYLKSASANIKPSC